MSDFRVGVGPIEVALSDIGDKLNQAIDSIRHALEPMTLCGRSQPDRVYTGFSQPDMMTMEPKDPRLVHLFDQSSAATRVWAATLRVFYQSLLEEGFAEQQALQLTRDYQVETLRSVEDWSRRNGI